MTAPKVQMPAKPVNPASKRKLKNEDYSTPYQPQTVLAAAPALVATDEPLRPYHQPDTLGIGGTTVVDDPLPTKRSEPYKYHQTFDGMAVGQAVRVSSGNVRKLASAMHHWINSTGKKESMHVRSTPNYGDDTGFGRVWLLAGKSLIPSRKKSAKKAA